jgi:hypothetical protein
VRNGKKALHVRAAEAIQAAIALGDLQRIHLPQLFIERHGVGVAGQHESAGTRAFRCDEVRLVRLARQLEYLAVEAEQREAFGEQVDDIAVAHVDRGICGTDRGQAQQGIEQLEKT